MGSVECYLYVLLRRRNRVTCRPQKKSKVFPDCEPTIMDTYVVAELGMKAKRKNEVKNIQMP